VDSFARIFLFDFLIAIRLLKQILFFMFLLQFWLFWLFLNFLKLNLNSLKVFVGEFFINKPRDPTNPEFWKLDVLLWKLLQFGGFTSLLFSLNLI